MILAFAVPYIIRHERPRATNRPIVVALKVQSSTDSRTLKYSAIKSTCLPTSFYLLLRSLVLLHHLCSSGETAFRAILLRVFPLRYCTSTSTTFFCFRMACFIESEHQKLSDTQISDPKSSVCRCVKVLGHTRRRTITYCLRE